MSKKKIPTKNNKSKDGPVEKLPLLFDFKESFLCYIKNPSNESQLLKEPRLIELYALFFSFKFKESFHYDITHFWVLSKIDPTISFSYQHSILANEI